MTFLTSYVYTCTGLYCTPVLCCSCLYTCSILYLSVHLYCAVLHCTLLMYTCTVQTVLYCSVQHYLITLLPPGWRPLVPGGHCQLRPRPLWRQHPRGVHKVRPSLYCSVHCTLLMYTVHCIPGVYPRSYIYVSLVLALTVNSLHVLPLYQSGRTHRVAQWHCCG